MEFISGYLVWVEVKICIVMKVVVEGLSVFGVLKIKDAALKGCLEEKGESDYGYE